MKMLLRAGGTFRTGARGPQDKKVLAPPAAKFELNGFAFGDEFVAVRASDFR